MKGASKIEVTIIITICAAVLMSGNGICQKWKRGKGNRSKGDQQQRVENLPPECQIKDIKLLFPMSGGFSFSPTDENLVIYAMPDKKGIHQIHSRYLNTGKDICLTCDNSNAPANDLNKGAPSFHPDGKHIILQVEMAEYPFKGQLTMGGGWFYNIWMTTVDGNKWWQLTNYSHGEKDRFGVLIPKISHNGRKVAWAQLYKGDSKSQYDYSQGKIIQNSTPWGLWQLNIADLIIDKNPRLENIKSYRPGNGNFFEPQDWSRDDKKLMFAADIQRDHVHKLDIWMMDINTEELTQLTNTDDAWEEFGSFSPNGRKISFMSSECCDWDPMSPVSIPFEASLMTELYLMDSDGTNKVQITNINEEGLPGTKWHKYLKGRKIITGNKWSSDGKKIFFGMVFFSKKKNKSLGNAVWELTFEESCGNSNP